MPRKELDDNAVDLFQYIPWCPTRDSNPESVSSYGCSITDCPPQGMRIAMSGLPSHLDTARLFSQGLHNDLVLDIYICIAHHAVF